MCYACSNVQLLMLRIAWTSGKNLLYKNKELAHYIAYYPVVQKPNYVQIQPFRHPMAPPTYGSL